MRNPFEIVKPFLVKHEPEILTGMGVSGMIFSVIWGIKATFKVAKVIRDYKDARNIDKITPKEAFKLSWRHYLPVVISAATSIPLIIGGNRIYNKRYATLAAAYTLSETALLEYQTATREIVGEKKAREIDEKVSADKVERTYSGESQIIMTNNGNSLFFEPVSGRYFESNWNDILRAANELNAEALSNISGQITLNEWFNKLGLEPTEVGENLGWDLKGNPGNLIDIEISSHLTPKDNRPCGAISYKRNPTNLDGYSY